ncbi:putative WD repeat-containing protein [Venturia nashicola]|uniref:Putative WD repeat-containing protein n=1 Tax=Venturia nashicola TaxID=86259 RepID=A0A4Z1NS11_9PEZI|nr:putative WD repeat-containing protein [Venturia nashicola]
MDPQLQSPLFSRLPGELREQIWKYALTSSGAIVDPTISPYPRTHFQPVPKLGVSLLRTCKRINTETSSAFLYSQNRFRFTNAHTMHHFLSINRNNPTPIVDVEIDMREVNDANAYKERELIKYLSWTKEDDTLWDHEIGGLRVDAPHLKTLRLNIEKWRFSESLRTVQLVQEFLRGPRELDRCVITGADGSELLFGAKERYIEKWGPVIFTGIMLFGKLAGMVQWMAGCVKGEKNDAIVRWSKVKKSVSLEVICREAFTKESGWGGYEKAMYATAQTVDSGCCSLVEYERRWHSGEWPTGR